MVSVGEVLIAAMLAIVAAELLDVCAWAARRMVRWAARFNYVDPERADQRAEEWAAIIDERPTQILKLVTATFFVTAGLERAAARRLPAWRKAFRRFRHSSVKPPRLVVFLTKSIFRAISLPAFYVVSGTVGYFFAPDLPVKIGIILFAVFSAVTAVFMVILGIRQGVPWRAPRANKTSAEV
jgi:hypothetical protein